MSIEKLFGVDFVKSDIVTINEKIKYLEKKINYQYWFIAISFAMGIFVGMLAY